MPAHSLTVDEIARELGAPVEGDGSRRVTGVADLREAGPEDLSFLCNETYRRYLPESRAAAVVIGSDLETGPVRPALMRVENPDLAFARAVDLLAGPEPDLDGGVHPDASVSAEARIAEGARIGARAVVMADATIGPGARLWPGVVVGEGAAVGADCRLYPGAVVAHGCRLGDRVILQPNAVVGSDGFGYAWDGSRHVKIRQAGNVVLEDDVELGACTTVDRARFGSTVIERGAKLDNLVQIAHNVRIGAHCAFAAQVGIAGSATIGAGTLMGGQAGCVGHVEVAPGCRISAKAGVTKNLPTGQYTGYPARPHKQYLREMHGLKTLERLRDRIKDLERRIAELET